MHEEFSWAQERGDNWTGKKLQQLSLSSKHRAMAVNPRGISGLWCTAENHINKKTKCPSWLDWLNPAHWWPDKKTCPFPVINIVYLSPSCFRQFSSVQSLSHVWLFATPWTAAGQASLPTTNSRSSLKLMFIELVMPSNHLILHHPLLLPSSIFPSIRVFYNESALRIRWPSYWSFSISTSFEYSRLTSFRLDWLFSL